MTQELKTVPTKGALIGRMAGRFGVDEGRLLSTLKATAFRLKDGEVTNEQMMALMVVSDQYQLNPFTREIFAFPDRNNGIVPVVSVDGWARIINEHAQMDGIEFLDGPEKEAIPTWIECVIYRKDRAHPTRVRERFTEVRRDTPTWKSHPSRMLRHKALIQCARIAFGFAGIYDQDEAERIVEMGNAEVIESVPMPKAKTPEAAPVVVQAAAAEIPAENPAPSASVISGAQARMIRAKLLNAEITEAEFERKFGLVDCLARTMINEALAWVENPA